MRTLTPLLLLCVSLGCAADDRSASSAATRLFAEKGPPSGWVVGHMRDVSKPVPEAKWFVNDDAVLTGTNTHDTWIMSEKEYGDFELSLEFKIPPKGNSGVSLRSPMHGDPAYDGMELQIVDPRYYEGHGEPGQLTGAIYRAVLPKKQAFKPEQWNRYEISCVGPRVKVVLNGEVVQDFNLDEQTQVTHRDKPELTALPLKERPRKGHIGFQDLCQDGRTQIRNVTLRVLDQ